MKPILLLTCMLMISCGTETANKRTKTSVPDYTPITTYPTDYTSTNGTSYPTYPNGNYTNTGYDYTSQYQNGQYNRGNCNYGYYSVNSTCLPIPTTGITTCQSGYTYNNGQCLQGQGNCSVGYVYQSGQCYPQNQNNCGVGYIYQNGQCYPQNQNNCGTGYTYYNGQCYPQNQNYCGTDHVYYNGQCYPQNQGHCGSDHVYYDGECHSRQDYCDTDYMSYICVIFNSASCCNTSRYHDCSDYCG